MFMSLLLVAVALLTHHSIATVGSMWGPTTVSTVFRYNNPIVDLTLDGNGNILFLVYFNTIVRRLFPDGSTSLVAGNGGTGSANGVGSAASFHSPCGLTSDVANNMAYVGDTLNYRIRRIDLADSNRVTTFAGSSSGHVDGTSAKFSHPYGLVHHISGVLYVADNAYIRKIVVASRNVSTVATLAARSLHLCVSRDNSLLYASATNTIVRVKTAIGEVSTLAGSSSSGYMDGVGSVARFDDLYGIALSFDESTLFISDTNNRRIRQLMLPTNYVSTVAGTGQDSFVDGAGSRATFSRVCGVKLRCNISGCGLLLAEYGNEAIRFMLTHNVTRSMSSSLSTVGTVTTSDSRSTTTSRPCLTRSTSIDGSSSSSPSSALASFTGSAVNTRTLSRDRSLSQSGLASLKASVSVTPSNSDSFSPTVDLSPSITATQSASTTMTTASEQVASLSILCALLPSNGSMSLGRLHPIVAMDDLAHGAIVLNELSGMHNSTSVFASPVSRRDILSRADIAMNLSLSLGGYIGGDESAYWPLIGVKLDLVPTSDLSSFPLVSTNVSFSVRFLSSSVSEQHVVLALHPPIISTSSSLPQWLPTHVSTFRDATLTLKLTLQCPVDNLFTSTIVVEVPCPGSDQSLAAEVKVASIVAQYVSMVSFPCTGTAVGRLLATRILVICNSDASASVVGLLPLTVQACDEEDDDYLSDARGAVLGNLLIWGSGVVLLIVFVFATSFLTHARMLHAINALGAPSQLFPLLFVTVPSTVSGMFYLLSSSSSCVTDRWMSALGVVMCATPIAATSVLAFIVPRRLQLVVATIPQSPRTTRVQSLLATLLHRHWRWSKVCRNTTASNQNVTDVVRPSTLFPQWHRVATVVLLEYAAVWYATLDVGVLTAVSILGAVGTLESDAACRGSAVAVLILYVVQFAICAAARPFTTLFSHIYTLMTLALAIIGIACQVWYLFEAEGGGNLDSMSRLLLAAAVCDLLVSGISLLKTVLDVGDALKALRRLFMEGVGIVELSSSVGGIEDKDMLPPHLADDERDVMEELFSLTGSVCDAAPHHNHLGYQQDDDANDESEFWNADGTAAVLLLATDAHYDDEMLADAGSVDPFSMRDEDTGNEDLLWLIDKDEIVANTS